MACFATSKFALTIYSLAFAAGIQAQTRSVVEHPVENGSAVTQVRIAELPRQVWETYELIRQGGPFPYEKDGMVFGNRERLLPIKKRGYYREYTVATPGLPSRGVRRIVCGGPPRMPYACYYTADHYASFRKIVSDR